MQVLGGKYSTLTILLIALVLRLFVLFTEGDKMFLGTDDDNYRESAETLFEKGVLTYGGWPEPTVFIMPGYPVVLATIFSVVGSTNWTAARIFQVGVSLGALWLLIRIGYYLGGRCTGITAGLLAAVYPPNLTAPCFLMTETVFGFLLLAVLFFVIKAGEARSTRLFVIAGLLVGISTYFRPTAGLLPIVFGIYLISRNYPLRTAAYHTVLMGAAVILVLSPWIARNYVRYNEFIPFTVSGGNPFLRGTYIDGKINEKFPWVQGKRIQSDRAQMDYGLNRFSEGFRTNPSEYLRWYTVGKFINSWKSPYYYKEHSLMKRSHVEKFHTILILSGAVGFILALVQRQHVAVLLLLVTWYFTFLHMVYLPGPRYSYPVVQLVVLISGFFIARLLIFIKSVFSIRS